jgi:MFS family permease
MLAGDVLRCGIFAGMTALASAGGSSYAVYVLAVTSTVVSGADQPAQAALLPSLVESPEELTAANVVGNTFSSIAMFVGPAVGGVLLALSGPAAVFGLTGASFLWSAAFVFRVPRDEPPERTGRSRFLPELKAGFSTVVHRPALRAVVGLSAAHALVEGTLYVLVVVLALRVLHSGNAGVGWLNTAMGVGSLVGAALVAVVARRRRLAGGFVAGTLLWGLPIAGAAALTSLPPALVLLALVGAGGVLVEVNGMTLLQRLTENELLGRIFAVLESLILAAMALGSVGAGFLVSWVGPRAILVASGLFLPALVLPLLPTLRRVDAEAEPATEQLALLRAIGFLGQLPEPVLEQLAGAAVAVTAAPGQPVVAQGEVGHHFYVIAEGRAAVEVDGARERELGPGDFFGEIALLRDVPRTATIRADGELRLYAIGRTDFLVAVTGHAPTLAAAENVVVARLPAGALAG